MFGAGAAIVPVVQGVPDMASRALIVMPPTIEVPPPPKITTAISIEGAVRAAGATCVIYLPENDGGLTQFRFGITSMSIGQKIETPDVTSLGGWRQYIPGIKTATVTMEISGEPVMLRG
jgi:hypothetical protein